MHNMMPSPKWNKAVDGFDSRELFRWMKEEEFRLLPMDTVFPLPGQVWEATRDCEVGFATLIEWSGLKNHKINLPNGSMVMVSGARDGTFPKDFCTVGTTRLQRGERVRVLDANPLNGEVDPKSLMTYVRPLRYDALHEVIVPAQLRTWPGYDGYWLEIRIARAITSPRTSGPYLNEDFRLVDWR
jgi:hypothetical protein